MRDKPLLVKDLIEVSKRNLDKAKLCAVQKLKDIENEELKLNLNALYRFKDYKTKIAASILNSIFYEKKAVFLMSKSVLENLIANDPNIGRSTVGGDFGAICSYLIGGSILKRIVDGAEFRGMSVYELSHEGML